ncbi:MAG: glycosyltransferase family 2 protein [Candidatus Marinimicrobia bacterium]|nr:glycosyltransferase family 2 protein [Candidatus Neomarinimicrobiota bacterium]MDD5582145.1 glycosyltransferase family 2 protein [Candidatus Neomarinimicrobiota bacterium]
MKISGFSFVRNGISLYYPVVESIQSILPIVDEFVVVVGQSDDNTREAIEEIGDPKIRIIDTVWDEKYFKKGIINALQTDIAKEHCTGDWLFYLQADEVVHEKYLPVVKARCEALLSNPDVEGLLFKYRHFWGDYDHYHISHGWYPYEIRIIRNRPDIHSYESAQSFRSFEYYDNPRQPGGTRKLKVALVDAWIYHYGWVRPPHLMQSKSKALSSLHWGLRRANDYYEKAPKEFDYGPLQKLGRFKETHPKVMEARIKSIDWQKSLQYSGKPNPSRKKHKHETVKYRFVTFIERLFRHPIGEFKNYILLRDV